MKKILLITLALFATGAVKADLMGNPIAAKDKVAMCIGCHGIKDYRVAYPEVYHVPKLGGQNAQYIVTALKDYKNGSRKFETMHAMAASLTDQDMADIAAYYAAQTSTTKNNSAK